MDSRKKTVLTVLCVASLILVWRVHGLIQKSSLPAQAEASPAAEIKGTCAVLSAPVPEKRVASPDNPTLWEVQRAVAAQPWGRDPFADAREASLVPETTEQPKSKEASSPAPPPALRFTGVSASEGKWLAVARGEIVRVGDVIDTKYTVVEITKRSLTLAADGWKFRYELGSEEPFVRPASEGP